MGPAATLGSFQSAILGIFILLSRPDSGFQKIVPLGARKKNESFEGLHVQLAFNTWICATSVQPSVP